MAKAGKETSKLQNSNQPQAEVSTPNELYGGGGSSKDTKEPEIAEAQVTTDQLVKMALTSHQETTATAKRAEN